MKTLKFLAFLLAATATITFTSCSDDDDDDVTVIDFENIELPKEGFLHDRAQTLNGVTFYHEDYGGFYYSKLTDKETPGWENQCSVYGNGGADKSTKFAVMNASYTEDSYFKFSDDQTKTFRDVMITNNTYAVLSIQNGDNISKKFENGDWFKVIFTGYNAAGEKTSEKPVEYYLADFRDGETHICTNWTKVDLTKLGKVNKVTVTFDSNVTNEYGISVPQYVCMDNLTYYND